MSDDITLEIEGTFIKCNKNDLMSNSDYFKVMFEGDFVEKSKNTIQLQDVDLKSMNIILTLIWDETYYIEDEDVLMVLQTACMLQFDKIRRVCIDKVIEILSVRNCLKIWVIAEQLDLKVISLKAKTMALEEFLIIKDTDSVLELSLEQVCNYLGSVHLKADNELSVFQTAIKWWYENGEHSSTHLIKLLSCIDFKSIIPDHFREILTYPCVANTDIGKLLKCLSNLISNIKPETDSKDILDKALLLKASKTRIKPSSPCILVKLEDKHANNSEDITVKDKYNRKRHYEVISPNNNVGLYILHLESKSNKFLEFFSLKEKIEGFKLIGYKEYIFMYGGEYTLGRGDWNRSFWAYNTIKDAWQMKSNLPFPRRHFEACIVGSKIYTVGGTGPFRVSQENLFWYDFKEDKWSKEISIPVFDRHIKCCTFMNKVFLFSVTNCCGYAFDQTENWTILPAKIDRHALDNQQGFSLFTYNNKIYLKGKKLIELHLIQDRLQVSTIRKITNKTYCKIESIVCDNLVFTLYGYSENAGIASADFTSSVFSLEKYNLDSGEIEFVFEDTNCIQVNEKLYCINEKFQLFPFVHYTLMQDDELVNCNLLF
ncbi:unnamed protein product [Phyllotreta striolata]|uniref:BTB domain-containing protein n=1 Tax=Phyllotreta striolata TaxID=444603 RepID=A0A9N9XLZ3_PHYSR|nr:unnamed protein product [Phyllotreta striolata]